MIRKLTIQDYQNFSALWKANANALSVPYEKILKDALTLHQSYGIFINDKLIGFGGYQVMQNKNEIRIIHICIDKNYRKQGYGFQIVSFIIQQIKMLNILKPIFVYYRKGAENNGFWEKYTYNEREEQHKKTMTVIKAKIKLDLFKNL